MKPKKLNPDAVEALGRDRMARMEAFAHAVAGSLNERWSSLVGVNRHVGLAQIGSEFRASTVAYALSQTGFGDTEGGHEVCANLKRLGMDDLHKFVEGGLRDIPTLRDVVEPA